RECVDGLELSDDRVGGGATELCREPVTKATGNRDLKCGGLQRSRVCRHVIIARREWRTHAQRPHATRAVTTELEAVLRHTKRAHVVRQSANVRCLQEVQEE